MGHDDRACFTQIFIPAAMVAMPVRIDQKFNRGCAKRSHRRLDFFGHRRVLIVNQRRPVFAIGNANVAASTKQNSDAGCQFLRLNLDF